jgi:hypothetical protein
MEKSSNPWVKRCHPEAAEILSVRRGSPNEEPALSPAPHRRSQRRLGQGSQSRRHRARESVSRIVRAGEPSTLYPRCRDQGSRLEAHGRSRAVSLSSRAALKPFKPMISAFVESHPSQSARRMGHPALEQLSFLSFGRSRCGWMKAGPRFRFVIARRNSSRIGACVRNSRPSPRTRRTGHPLCWRCQRGQKPDPPAQ